MMDGQSGIVTLSGHRKQRMEPTYNLNVSVSDGVFTSTAQVHVTVRGANLYSPAFALNTYDGEVRENAPVGTKVAQVRSIFYCIQLRVLSVVCEIVISQYVSHIYLLGLSSDYNI